MKKTFEETYPLYPFSTLVALTIEIAAAFARPRGERREARSVGRRPVADPKAARASRGSLALSCPGQGFSPGLHRIRPQAPAAGAGSSAAPATM